MRGMESDCFDLIYLDPPFNSKKQWSAPIGSTAAGAAFKDTWTLRDIDEIEVEHMERTQPRIAQLINVVGEINGNADKSYLIMMAPRLLEMRRILKPTGSIYLHCDPTMSHSLKLMMDGIFGAQNFRNEIVWHYGLGGFRAQKDFPKKHDVILRYSKTSSHYFEVLRGEVTDAMRKKYCHQDENGFYMKSRGKKYYLKGGKPYDSVWNIATIAATAKERTGYPTQKPRALLERIVKSSSPQGGWVLDPFCGCATAAVAAENLGRKWVGIDLSPKAAELVVQRFEDELGLFSGTDYAPTHRTDLPKRARDIVRTPKAQLKARLYGEQAGNCAGCEEHFDIRHFEIDHIVPASRGGHDGDDNKQLLCGNCNRRKGDKSQAYLKSRQAAVSPAY